MRTRATLLTVLILAILATVFAAGCQRGGGGGEVDDGGGGGGGGRDFIETYRSSAGLPYDNAGD